MNMTNERNFIKHIFLKINLNREHFVFVTRFFKGTFSAKFLISILLYQIAIFNYFQLFAFLTSHFGDVEDSFLKKFELEGELKLGEL